MRFKRGLLVKGYKGITQIEQEKRMEKVISLIDYIERKDEEEEYKIPDICFVPVAMTEELMHRETARRIRAKYGIKSCESDGEIIE